MKPTQQKKLPSWIEINATSPELKKAVENQIQKELQTMENEAPKLCSVCARDYYGFGNNAWPINAGRCCDDCNQIVIAHRIKNVSRGRGAYGYPEWCNKEFMEELIQFLNKPSTPQPTRTQS